uniref:Uncharacterized protein n=1 Tax=Apteryx owenii TaxID=8824 RepID=A0A8B9PKA8_APTOW
MLKQRGRQAVISCSIPKFAIIKKKHCLICYLTLLKACRSSPQSFGDHIHWRTLEDGKKEAAARYVI